MQGALYFPYIAVPESAWLTRTLLYWDQVGTVVPMAHTHEPEYLDPYTLDLIQSGLIHQITPNEADENMAQKFGQYLESFDERLLAARRRSLAQGRFSLIHQDKFFLYRTGLNQIQWLGLCLPFDHADSWIAVETTTAGEFMAALALALCHPASGWATERRRQGLESSWVPVTDRVEAIDGLLAGLSATRSTTAGNDELRLRVNGQIRTAEIRSMMIERLLPVSTEPVDIDRILRFRRKFGDYLPRFRRHFETLMDRALATEDETVRFRMLDRVVEEADEMADQAQSYLRQSGIRRVARSPLLKLLKFVPLLHDPVETMQEFVGEGLTHRDLPNEPLAYLAFARAEFSPITRYSVDPLTGIPLVQAMS